jgi:mannose-6-phosphate isomerase-like protein (cupin superfamily)
MLEYWRNESPFAIGLRQRTRDIVSLDLSLGVTEEAQMAGVDKRNFDSPDETRTPDKTRVDVVRMGGTTAARLAMEPGWRWSDCVKPVARTDSCQHRHVGVVQSGRMRVTHNDGTTIEIGPGEAYVIEPGHDAEIVGDEGFVGFEFEREAAEAYARE